MNGRDLPRITISGGRAIVPGYYGMLAFKWLTRSHPYAAVSRLLADSGCTPTEIDRWKAGTTGAYRASCIVFLLK